MTYDDWKTTPPEDTKPDISCDICGDASENVEELCLCGKCCQIVARRKSPIASQLETAVQLLRDAAWNLREADRSHLASPISDFLATVKQ